MIREETSIVEKIIKLFPEENIVLNKSLNNRKPDIWFKGYNIIAEVEKEIMKIMMLMTRQKEKICLKSIILKFFAVILMILILIFLNS